MEEIFVFVREFGIGIRQPNSDFYKEGNDACQALHPLGIEDFDNEDFYHKPYCQFSCHIPGCNRTFETVMQYESHYNSCHSFTCQECNKNLPNFHLLDLHILETHDFFFLEQAKRKPMYKCFLEKCSESFKSPMERRDHCIEVHKYPCDFRYDATRKKKKNTKKKVADDVQMDTAVSVEDNSEMDISECKTKETDNQRNKNMKSFLFGRAPSKRKPVLSSFSKDLLNSLPGP